MAHHFNAVDFNPPTYDQNTQLPLQDIEDVPSEEVVCGPLNCLCFIKLLRFFTWKEIVTRLTGLNRRTRGLIFEFTDLFQGKRTLYVDLTRSGKREYK